MSTKNKLICFLTGLVTGAIFNWPLSYGDIDLWGIDHRYYMVIATLLLAFFLKLFMSNLISPVAVFLATGVVAAPAFRFVYEIVQDPTSNNLWPIAMALYVLLIFPAAFLGAFLAQMVSRSRES